MQNFDTVLREINFIGMDNKHPSHLLPPGMFSLLQNVVIDSDQIKKRPGTSTSSQVGSATNINGGSAFEPNGGTKMQIVSADGASHAQLQVSTNGTTWSTIGSANLTKATPINFVQASNYLFGFNGVEVVDVASDGSTVTKNRSGVPLGTYGFWFHNYLFVAGVTGTPNRLFWSNLGDPTTWTNTNFIDINANDGDMITGLSTFNDELLVVKNNSFWTITGWSGTTFSATTVAGQNTAAPIYGFGSPSHRGLVPAGASFFYLSFVGGIPQIRELRRSLYGVILDGGVVSFDIEGTMNSLNNASLSMTTGLYDGKYVYFAVPSSGSSINDTVLVYYPNLQTRAPWGTAHSWCIWKGINVEDFFESKISGQAKIYFPDASTSGKVFHLDSSVSTDNGTAVSMDVKTRDFMGDIQGARKIKYKYLYTKYGTGSPGTLTINSRLDSAATYGLEESFSLQGNSPGLGSSAGSFTLGSSILGGAVLSEHRTTLQHKIGHLLGVEFTETTANPCTIFDFELFGLKKGLRNS